MKGLCVSWTAKKTNEWVLNKAGVTTEGTVRHCQSKEANGHYMRKQGNCLEKDKWRKYVHGVANPRIEEG